MSTLVFNLTFLVFDFVTTAMSKLKTFYKTVELVDLAGTQHEIGEMHFQLLDGHEFFQLGSAKRVTLLVGLPALRKRVTLLAGTTFRHVNTLSLSAEPKLALRACVFGKFVPNLLSA